MRLAGRRGHQERQVSGCDPLRRQVAGQGAPLLGVWNASCVLGCSPLRSATAASGTCFWTACDMSALGIKQVPRSGCQCREQGHILRAQPSLKRTFFLQKSAGSNQSIALQCCCMYTELCLTFWPPVLAACACGKWPLDAWSGPGSCFHHLHGQGMVGTPSRCKNKNAPLMRSLQVEVDLGKFDSADEAARAHDRAAVWCLGLTATTNFPVTDTLRVRSPSGGASLPQLPPPGSTHGEHATGGLLATSDGHAHGHRLQVVDHLASKLGKPMTGLGSRTAGKS